MTVGSEMRGRIFWNDINTGVTARVVGIYERVDSSLPVWRIYDEAFSVRGLQLEFARYVVPEATILDSLARRFPAMGADFAWVLDTDPGKITAADTTDIQRGLLVTNAELKTNLDNFALRTELPNVLNRFETDLFFNRLPMFIVLILIVLALLGALPTWGWSRSWGYGPSGVLGVVLLVLIILLVMGRL